MKIFKYLGIGLLVLIGIPLIAALFISKDLNYEKSITINAPIDSVWLNISSLSAMDKWSPWNDHDPNMKKSITGTDGEIGATASWESSVKEVGIGSQTIARIEKPTLFETDLKFLAPMESESKAYVHLSPDGEGTKATWGFKSEIPYPFNFTKLFMNMDEMMGKDWDNGLGKLKALSEK